ncbi:hypothetical protein ABFS82_09G029700 [Erythranthe guttata]|nr:PREDICTED: probable pectinesterase 56 isoform X2 [Erythranthe guttata]|eukprot:XP_012831148.1 PREDICTED: probable pectinesterase 56 isoform X2 [Erythranthe guttata]
MDEVSLASHVSSSRPSFAVEPSDIEYLEAPAASESSGYNSSSHGSGRSVDSLAVGAGSPMSVGSVPSNPRTPDPLRDGPDPLRDGPDPLRDGPDPLPPNPVQVGGFNWMRSFKVIGAIVFVCALALLIALVITGRTKKKEDHCKISISVSGDGKSEYRTISEAVEASPSYSSFRVCIRIGAGEYNEKVRIAPDKINITLLGEGVEKTVITSNATLPISLMGRYAATLWVGGQDFLAQDLTISNTAKDGVAVENSGDHTVFFRCTLRGMNMTLHALGLKQFYRSCQFYGRNHLVLGNDHSFFQKSEFFSERSDEKIVFFGQSRNFVDHKTGFIFHQCAFYTNNSEVYLGSAIGNYAFFVVMQSYLDAHIAGYFVDSPHFNGSYFAIFGNSGGSLSLPSAPSSVVDALSRTEVDSRFSLRSFLGSMTWIPDEVDRDLDLAR